MELRLALVQTALHWEDPPANRKHFDAVLGRLQGPRDLIVLPEMFTTGFTMEPGNLDPAEAGRTLEWMRARAAEMDTALAGSLVWPLEGSFANRFVFMRPDGTYEYYDKRHTFTLAGEDKVYRRGTRKEVWEFRGFRICPQVCYDLRFPVFSRNVEGYDLVLYVANWPHVRIHAWDTLLKARAIENMAFSAGVNRLGEDPNGHRYTGHSGIYDSLGNTLGFSEAEGVIDAVLDRQELLKTREKLRFLQDRDTFSPGWE